jgi:6-phosphogluconate dehydrogenase
MQVGMIGLGKMGGNMARRLMAGGHDVAAFDIDLDAVSQITEEGATGASSIADLVGGLTAPRAVWVMVPAGDITEQTVAEVAEHLAEGDTIIDGGNSRFSDTVRRAETLRASGISYVDAGTSGGIWGLEEGYCLMVGADQGVFDRLEPLFETLAPEHGYARVGAVGAGHFTKMVHNGVEYALMQAYGEGFDILKASDFDLDIGQVAELWRHGSVIRSWLLDLAAAAFEKDPELSGLSGRVDDSGEGRWALETAISSGVPAPTIAAALFNRFASQKQDSFSNKVLAALRREFGGHAVHPKERDVDPEDHD